MSSELWKEKCIHEGEVISAWLVVLIEVVIVLLIFGIAASDCCEPTHPRIIHTAASGSSHDFMPKESAHGLRMPRGAVANSCGCSPNEADEVRPSAIG